MGPPESVGNMAPELLVEMLKRAMASDIARLEGRLDQGDFRLVEVVTKINENDSRFLLLEERIDKSPRPTTTRTSASRRWSRRWRNSPRPTHQPRGSPQRRSPRHLPRVRGRGYAHHLSLRSQAEWLRQELYRLHDGLRRCFAFVVGPPTAPPSTKIRRGEAELLDTEIKNIAGKLYDFTSFLPPWVANQQLSYCTSNDYDVFEVRRDLNIVLDCHEITVHDKSVNIVLEQSSERKRDYGKSMGVHGRLFNHLVCDEVFLAFCTECQMLLRLFITGF